MHGPIDDDEDVWMDDPLIDDEVEPEKDPADDIDEEEEDPEKDPADEDEDEVPDDIPEDVHHDHAHNEDDEDVISVMSHDDDLGPDWQHLLDVSDIQKDELAQKLFQRSRP